MSGKSIDEYMVEDRGYDDEIKQICREPDEALKEAKTDVEREVIRRDAIARFQQAGYARYDRAKRLADQEAGRWER